MEEEAILTISVITVVKNAETSIASTIDSLVSQTTDKFNIEYIIVDGESEDNTWKIIEEYAVQISSVLSLVKVSQKDDSIYEAMDRGRKLATGDFIFYLNSGDVFESTTVLKDVVQYMNNNKEKNCLYFGIVRINTVGLTWNVPNLNLASIDSNPLNSGYFPHHQSVFYPKVFYTQNTYDLKFKISGDVDYTMRACKTLPTKYMGITICSVQLDGMYSGKLNIAKILKEYDERIYLMQKHDGRVSSLKKIVIIMILTGKYLSDTILGSRTKHLLMFLFSKYRSRLSA